MIVIKEVVLDLFRSPGLCEWCKGRCIVRDPHHIWAKGMGGSNRRDVRINLISLCRFCHRLVHDGEIARCDLLLIVAAREHTMQGAIESVIRWLMRVDKHASPERVAKSIACMRPGRWLWPGKHGPRFRGGRLCRLPRPVNAAW